MKNVYETQMNEAVVQADDILDKPAQWDRHFRRTTSSVILAILYGHPTLTSKQDHTVQAIGDFSDRVFRAAAMGAHVVEFFPWMRHFPSR